jgi:hypothetical protein
VVNKQRATADSKPSLDASRLLFPWHTEAVRSSETSGSFWALQRHSPQYTTYAFLQNVIIVADVVAPVAQMRVEPAEGWSDLSLVEAEVPLPDGSSRVAQIFEVLGQ